jgi:hypothetical protein
MEGIMYRALLMIGANQCWSELLTKRLQWRMKLISYSKFGVKIPEYYYDLLEPTDHEVKNHIYNECNYKRLGNGGYRIQLLIQMEKIMERKQYDRLFTQMEMIARRMYKRKKKKSQLVEAKLVKMKYSMKKKENWVRKVLRRKIYAKWRETVKKKTSGNMVLRNSDYKQEGFMGRNVKELMENVNVYWTKRIRFRRKIKLKQIRKNAVKFKKVLRKKMEEFGHYIGKKKERKS